MSIARNLKRVWEHIALVAERAGRKSEEVKLVVVSKGCSVEEIQEAYFAGVRDFGEHRVQELLEKMDKVPADIRWHFIGKLQKNKVNKVVGKCALIHSVDSLELAQRISQVSVRLGIRTAILLEANTSREETKSGLTPEEWEKVFPKLLDLKGIRIEGLMTMAPLTEEESLIRHCFSELRHFRDRLQGRADVSTLSMGMTNDYPIAIQEGATLLRIGTAIFHETHS